MSFSKSQRERAKANSAAAAKRKAAQQQETSIDWDTAIAGFKQVLDEVYGTTTGRES